MEAASHRSASANASLGENLQARSWSAGLPHIRYEAHPAYAAAVWRPPLRRRLRALGMFSAGLARALTRWLADVEHLPRPPRDAVRHRWLAGNALAIAQAVLRNSRARLFPRQSWQLMEAGRHCRDRLDATGLASFRLDAQEKDEMRRRLAPYFAELEARLATIPDHALHFDDNRHRIDPAANPELYRWFEERLERYGVLSGSSAHLRRQVRVAHLAPQINTPRTDFWTGRFADIGLADTACNYCHVDTAHNTTKMIIYLGEVGPESGPFSYVLGSHRTGRDFFDRLVRRAIDHSGLTATDPAMRALFAALPRMLRRKGSFGQDLQDDHSIAEAILGNERRILSVESDCILFDPAGIHRGGMVRRGERRIVGVVLADRLDPL